jgi:apolipoprotein N-acyltransferase
VVGPYFPWAHLGYLLLLVLLGGLAALFGWLCFVLHQGRGVHLGLAVPLAWVGVEWIKGHFPLDLAFPWLGLGVTLSGWPELLALAEWTGELGVAFWLAGVNGLISAAILTRGTTHTRNSWIVVVGMVLGPGIVGLVRAETLALEDGPHVVVVGTAVAPGHRGNPEESTLEALAQVRSALEGVGPGSTDLVVLPEGTVAFPLEDRRAQAAREALAELAARLDAPLAFGALGQGDVGTGQALPTNSAYLLMPGDTSLQRYHKTRLVPAMEAGRYRRGSDQEPFSAGGWRLTPLICYESLFGGVARRGRKAGADLLLNLSSDIWFGRGGSLIGSLFLHQHPAHLVLRAVETRTPVVRSANGGFTTILDPLGRASLAALPPEGGRTGARIRVFRGTTLFTKIGDWVGPGCILLCAVLAAPGRKRPFNVGLC